MYKSDIKDAVDYIRLAPGGTIAGLIKVIEAAELGLHAAYADVATNNDAKVRSGRARVQEELRIVGQWFGEISPSAAAVEFHHMGSRFDAVLEKNALLEPLLRPGREALAALAGAFDIAIQQHRKPPFLLGLIAPGVALAKAYSYYDALSRLFSDAEDDGSQESTGLTIAGADRLSVFSVYVSLLSSLADAAGSATGESGAEGISVSENNVSILSIESGSPIKISLTGGAKTLRLLAAMLRDLVRSAYQNVTVHGRAVQAMETLALARELGVDGEAMDSLRAAVAQGARDYADTFRHEDVSLSIDGVSEPVAGLATPQVSQEKMMDSDRRLPRLKGPKS